MALSQTVACPVSGKKAGQTKLPSGLSPQSDWARLGHFLGADRTLFRPLVEESRSFGFVFCSTASSFLAVDSRYTRSPDGCLKHTSVLLLSQVWKNDSLETRMGQPRGLSEQQESFGVSAQTSKFG
jgi:hypothetical protein